MIKLIIKALAILTVLADREQARLQRKQDRYRKNEADRAKKLAALRAELEAEVSGLTKEISTANANAVIGCWVTDQDKWQAVRLREACKNLIK